MSLTSTLFEALVSRLIYYPTAYPSLPRVIATVHDRDSQGLGKVLRAGISPGTSGILWSLSVAAEVVVFVVVGRPLLDRIGPAGAAVLSAGAGVVRWAVMAETAWLPALALIEPLHGLTFALLHLTCMRLLAQCVPRHLEAQH